MTLNEILKEQDKKISELIPKMFEMVEISLPVSFLSLLNDDERKLVLYSSQYMMSIEPKRNFIFDFKFDKGDLIFFYIGFGEINQPLILKRAFYLKTQTMSLLTPKWIIDFFKWI